MDDAQILAAVVLAAVCLVAAIVAFRRRQASAEQEQTQLGSPRNRGRSARGEALMQRLRQITIYDEAKIERLIRLERDELKRKGNAEETLDDLMERAVARWERDNAGTAALY